MHFAKTAENLGLAKQISYVHLSSSLRLLVVRFKGVENFQAVGASLACLRISDLRLRQGAVPNGEAADLAAIVAFQRSTTDEYLTIDSGIVAARIITRAGNLCAVHIVSNLQRGAQDMSNVHWTLSQPTPETTPAACWVDFDNTRTM